MRSQESGNQSLELALTGRDAENTSLRYIAMMGKQFQLRSYCMASAAFFSVLALADFSAPEAPCLIKPPIWAAWLCTGAGFAGAGLSQRPLRGSAIGVALVLIPATIIGLIQDLIQTGPDGFAQFGMLVFLGILAVVFSKATSPKTRQK